MTMSTRKKVKIPDKAWLDSFKFLMGPQWQKVRFVSRQLNEVVKGNISELPRIIIDNVKFSDIYMHSKPIEMIASGITISSNEKREWFMKRGINPDAPTDLQHQDAVIGMGSKYGNLHKPSIYYCAYVNELGGESKITGQYWKTGWQKIDQGFQEHRKPMLFAAAFNPDLNEYSCASMEYFLNLLYNPLTYIKEVEMFALNKNLTDAFFLGEDYGSYIRCGRFTLIGDLCKSLPWIHKNVRADTICLPGDYTDKENSYKEATNFLLETPWTCANQNVKTVNIELEWVRHWKWLIKSLLKKFRTLATIDHDTPSIEFPFYKEYWEKLKLDFLIWDPEVVEMKPDDSQGTKTVYVVFNGRNKMEIAIFKRAENMDTFSSLPVSYRKRAEDIYNVSIKTYTIESASSSREKLHFSNDTWLQALKFLSFSNWSKTLFVSRQLAGIVQSNISRLPCIVISHAGMIEEVKTRSDTRIISFGDRLTCNWPKHFFTELGISLNAPADVQHENALLGFSNDSDFLIEMYLDGTAPISKIFDAQFSKHNEHSWASLKYFLEFLYYPAMYTKEVGMFAVNQKMVDDLFEGEKRFIRCGAFTLKGESEWNMDEFYKSLSWLEQNVRANTINLPNIDYENENVYEPLANFLFDTSWKCASQKVNFEYIVNADSFVKAIVQKFQTVSFIRNDIPMFMLSTYGDDDQPMNFLLSAPNILKLESQKPYVRNQGYGIRRTETKDKYVISNGDNRMQIEIVTIKLSQVGTNDKKFIKIFTNSKFV